MMNKNQYQESLNELKGQLKTMLPVEALNTFNQDAEELGKNYSSVLKIKEGEQAPGFQLTNATGEQVSLEELLKKGKVVLVFYRGAWCPYCNLQLSTYQKNIDAMENLGASLVAISPQSPDHSLSMKEKSELKFEVLSDKGNQVSRKYTTVFKNGDAPIKAMADLGYDFDAFYEDNSREIPVPAVFVIDQGGEVLLARSEGGDYRNRVEPSEIMDVLAKNIEKINN